MDEYGGAALDEVQAVPRDGLARVDRHLCERAPSLERRAWILGLEGLCDLDKVLLEDGKIRDIARPGDFVEEQVTRGFE